MAREVVLSVGDGHWNCWGERFVRRQPLRRIQHIVPRNPSVAQAKAALLKAIAAAGSAGRLIIRVGHGAEGGEAGPRRGMFDLAPDKAMRVVGYLQQDGFVDVFYDVNVDGPPSMSGLEHDRKNSPASPRLAHWATYQDIARAFRAAQLYDVVLLTCRVGSSTEFLRKVANDWGVVVRAYTRQVALTTETTTVGRRATHRYYLHLANNPPDGKTADQLVTMEEEIPYAPGDMYAVGPPLAPAGTP